MNYIHICRASTMFSFRPGGQLLKQCSRRNFTSTLPHGADFTHVVSLCGIYMNLTVQTDITCAGDRCWSGWPGYCT